jgi:exodeoxyribonuclease-3
MASKTLKIISWNVNGIRAAAKKGLMDYLKKEDPDIFCVQETKSLKEQVLAEKAAAPLFDLGYEIFWHSAEKKGYSGVATFVKTKPLHVITGFEKDGPQNFNHEGRLVIVEYKDFELWNGYFPNGGRGPDRVQYKLEFYDHCFDLWQKRRKKKAVIICGDFNTAHQPIDLARPKENEKNTGFLPVERAFLDRMVEHGYEDVFRRFHPDETGHYTYWDQITRARERNVGWRIDYFFVSSEGKDKVKNAYLQPDVMGSDHCPLVLEYEHV